MNNQKNESITGAQALRLKAETQLHIKQLDTGIPESEIEIKKMLHELQVHQIELEMQNEELREANEATELALKKYTMLYDLAPMGYFTLDKNCNITELNFTGAEMLGERRFSLINNNFKLYIAPESKATFHDFFNEVFSSNYKESCVVQLGYDKKILNRVYMEGVVAGDDSSCLLSLVDMTNLHSPDKI